MVQFSLVSLFNGISVSVGCLKLKAIHEES